MYSLFGLLNDNIGSLLWCNLFGQNANMGTGMQLMSTFSVLTPITLSNLVYLPLLTIVPKNVIKELNEIQK